MCWCPLDEPCHADSLLRIANSVSEVDRVAIAADTEFDRTEDARDRYQEEVTT